MKRVQDHYFKRAKKEGFPARSVYKLKEAQRRFRLLRSGMKVLDLGASPGSWTRYASDIVGKDGLVVAVDLHDLKFHGPNTVFMKADSLMLDAQKLTEEFGRFHCVLSDMAPKTTGRRDVDHYRSVELATAALNIAMAVLVPDGRFFVKVFQGADFDLFRKGCMNSFEKVRVFKPRSSRPESVEIFIYMEELKT